MTLFVISKLWFDVRELANSQLTEAIISELRANFAEQIQRQKHNSIMKKAIKIALAAIALFALNHTNAVAQNGQPQRTHRHHQQTVQPIDTTGVETLTREADGTYVINTTRIGYDFRGYRGPTPLQIRIKKNKIVSVIALRNHETPRYFAPVIEQLLPKYVGKTIREAKDSDVDVVTGATYSSNAVKENVRRGLEYYEQHK